MLKRNGEGVTGRKDSVKQSDRRLSEWCQFVDERLHVQPFGNAAVNDLAIKLSKRERASGIGSCSLQAPEPSISQRFFNAPDVS